MNYRSLGLLALAGIAAFTACSGSSTNNSTTTPACNPGTNVAMIYPIPGATGVPDALGYVVLDVSGSTGLGTNWNLFLAPTNSSTVVSTSGLSVTAPSPAPTPSSAPGYSPGTVEFAATSALAPATTYQVFINDLSSTCTATPVQNATFTTQ
ncbi:MAG: hypothetical protein JOZ38_07975 [Candidatus Eremiobacteraeota bacterium]|nr:hypothetical protein [Candidatus Eremiobacteraeota bacterium]